MIVWQLNLQLPMQEVSITNSVLNSNHTQTSCITTLGHIILIPSQPLVGLTLVACLTEEVANTNVKVFGLIRPGIRHMLL
jgi:hypothetical protein